MYARFVLLLPRSSPADQTRWLTCQSRKQTTYPKKVGFTRNRTRPTTKYHPFLLPKSIMRQRGTMVGTSNTRRKRGKSDPRVRFLVKECVQDHRLLGTNSHYRLIEQCSLVLTHA